MIIERNGRRIESIEQWRQFAHPKSPDQWVQGRSAFELARAWCGSGEPEMPTGIRSLLNSQSETRGLRIDLATPECPIRFDNCGGEPRNADMALVGRKNGSTIVITIEAKADEPFGATVSDTFADALERHVENPKSHGILRIEQLASRIVKKLNRTASG